jgi:uncharacterized membrane protein
LREGEKTTPAEQLAPAAKPSVQVFCTRLKGDAVVSASEVAAELPLLVSVTVCAALEAPGATTGKTSCAGLTFNPVEDCPVPVRGTVTDATPEVDEETTSEVVAPPAAVGVKITGTVQLPPLASVEPQVVVPVEKFLAETPVSESQRWTSALRPYCSPSASVANWLRPPSARQRSGSPG